VADKCRFKDTNQPVNEKAALDRFRRNQINNKTSPESVESELEGPGSDVIDALGYMPSHLLFDLPSKYEVGEPGLLNVPAPSLTISFP
jgi:hypothetical protein